MRFDRSSGWSFRAPLVLMLLLVRLFPLVPAEAKSLLPRAEQGVLDLRGIDEAFDEVRPLGGEWEFVYGRFEPPGATHRGLPLRGAEFAPLPSTWKGTTFKGETLPGSGYATYRLRILLGPRSHERLALLVPAWETAYALYADGTLVAEEGTPGTDRDSTAPRWRPVVADFPVTGETLELLAHVSNFHHARGGPAMTPMLGTPRAVREFREKGIVAKSFTFGSLLMIALYHFAIFLPRRGERSALYFALFCLLMAARALVIDEQCILLLFPDIPWNLHVRLAYLPFTLAVPSFTLFLGSLYGHEMRPGVSAAFNAVAAAYTALIIFTPPYLFTALLAPFQIVLALGALYCLAVLALAVRGKRDGAPLFLGAFAVYLACIVNDLCYHRLLVDTAYIAPSGFLVFIFLQSVALARRYPDAFKKIEALDREKTTLERTAVTLRTLTRIDPLTGIANRRRFDERLANEWRRSAREESPLALIMMDLDFFKRFNDHYGHTAGDDVLRRCAAALHNAAKRPADLVARFGGEEFAALLPNTGLDGAVALAETMRAAVEELDIDRDDGTPFGKVTISMGCASTTPDARNDPLELVKMADAALYISKKRGRNRVECAPPEEEPTGRRSAVRSSLR